MGQDQAVILQTQSANLLIQGVSPKLILCALIAFKCGLKGHKPKALNRFRTSRITGWISRITGRIGRITGWVNRITGRIGRITGWVSRIADLISRITGWISRIADLISRITD